MADGGWIYHYYEQLPHDGSNTNEALAMDGLIAVQVAMSGWSIHTAKTAYMSSAAWWWCIQHTSGSRIVFIKNGDNGSASNLIDAANDQYLVARVANTVEGNMFAAYLPPSVVGAFTGNPDSASFFPAGQKLRFFPLLSYTEFNPGGNPPSGRRHIYHMFARGDGLCFAMAADVQDNPAVVWMNWMGELFDKLQNVSHPTHPDTHAEAKYGSVCIEDMDNLWSCRWQGFNADHNGTVVGSYVSTGGWIFHSGLLNTSMNDRPPWNWQSPICYRSSVDIATTGVVPGNGMKGTVSPEWMRMCCVSGGPVNDKQRMNGGNFIYLRNGFVTGFDPSNGAMK